MGGKSVAWERRVETKGGYHPHMQMCRVEADVDVAKVLLPAMMRLGVRPREVQNPDMKLSTVVGDGDYFYFEVGAAGGGRRRWVVTGEDARRVPVQFGREVVCVCLGKGERAHWKSCVKDQEGEEEDVKKFREVWTREGGEGGD